MDINQTKESYRQGTMKAVLPGAFLLLVLIMLCFPTNRAYAADVTTSIEDGSITVEVQSGGTQALVKQAGKPDTPFTIADDTLTITGSSSANTVIVDGKSIPHASLKIVLNGVSIVASASNSGCAFSLTNGAQVELMLSGQNTLQSGAYRAGLQVGEQCAVVIDEAVSNSGASLRAQSAGHGAGVGGRLASGAMTFSCGDITINGGSITAISSATGDGRGAGIGTGSALNGATTTCGNITINGGSVYAASSTAGIGYGAGIGTGDVPITASNTCGDITISGGTIKAYSASGAGAGNGAGIGTGQTEESSNNTCGNITITGGSVETYSSLAGNGNGAAIGTGTIFDGTTSCGNISLSGGTIIAIAAGGTRNNYNAGIGLGRWQNGGTRICGDITITGGSVTAKARAGDPSPTINPAPTSNGATAVYLVKVGISNSSGVLASSALDASHPFVQELTYGLDDVYTDGEGFCYFYLPAGSYIEPSLKLGGVPFECSGSNSQPSFDMTVAANDANTAQFTWLQTLTTTASLGGSLASDISGTYPVGGPLSLEAIPNTGYDFTGWEVTGMTLSDPEANPLGFTMPTADATLNASFAKQTFIISATAGPNGSITPSGDSSITYGEGISYTITPNPGYVVKDVLVDGSSVGAVDSYDFTNVDAAHSIEASFAKAPPIYRTLTNAEQGITVSGYMAKETTLKVKSGLGSLHPQGTCKTCDEIRMKYEAGALQLLYDISLEGEYTSPLTITFKVGKNYDGYKATIYHCKNGTLELYEATVSDGMITIKVDALSPFGIVLTPPGTKALPQTGDGSPLAALLAAGGVFAALIVIAFVKRRASAQE